MLEYHGVLYDLETNQSGLFFGTLDSILDEEREVSCQPARSIDRNKNWYYYQIGKDELLTNMDDFFYKNVIEMIDNISCNNAVNTISIRLEDKELNLDTELSCDEDQTVTIKNYIYSDSEKRIHRGGEWGNPPPTSTVQIPRVALNAYFDDMIINLMLGST